MGLRIYRILITLFLIWSIISTVCLAYYYNQYLSLSRQYNVLYRDYEELVKQYNSIVEENRKLNASLIYVDMLIDYGNGTYTWFNNTIVTRNTTLFQATVKICLVEYKVYSFGIYITSINGVSEKKVAGGGYSWIWYYWNTTSNKWEMGSVGADHYVLSNGDIVMWKYTKW